MHTLTQNSVRGRMCAKSRAQQEGEGEGKPYKFIKEEEELEIHSSSCVQ